MYIPTNLHTHYSLLRSFIKTDSLAKKLAEYEMPACCLTDFDVLSGSVSFFSECKKNNIKPILGIKLFVECYLGDGKYSCDKKYVTSAEDIKYTPNMLSGYVTLIAQNLKGWKELVAISSMSYLPNHYVDRPTVSVEELFGIKNCLVMMGTQESLLFNSVFGNNPSYTNPIVDSSNAQVTNDIIESFKSAFGDRLFFQLERFNESYASLLAADIIAEKARLFHVKTVAAPSPNYLDTYDKSDQLLLTATKLGCSVNELSSKTKELEFTVYNQLLHKDFSLPNPRDFAAHYTEEEVKNTLLVADMCDEYNILSSPNLPRFKTPDGFTEESYLKQLCRDGWASKIAGKIDESRTKEYVDRVLYELGIINGANLSGYFLIVQEYVNWAKNQGWLVGPGRGSAAGCFVSYLTNITTIDPIKHGLFFERFYNAGRNTKDHISLPDIDVDFCPNHREPVSKHISDLYGKDHVCQVVTFSRLSGRGALKEVFRATTACTNSEMDEITSKIPQESEIADRMEEEQETSIIRWTINNEPKNIERWVQKTNNGLTGDLAHCFEQAIRIEGTYKSYGKHASALVVSGTSLTDSFPMIKEKSSNELILGIEYEFAEKAGACKLDILGLNTLQKLMDVNSLLRFGKI